MNQLHKNLEFRMTLEEESKISYLGVMITRSSAPVDEDTQHETTVTGATPNHPTEHKLAVYRSCIEGLHALSLPKKRERERN